MTPPDSAGTARALGARAIAAPASTVPWRAPSRPRRVSGPARSRSAPVPARRPQRGSGAIALPAIPLHAPALARRALGLLAELPGHLAIERLIRGRAWIALIAFALIGVVSLQLLLLKLNGGIGHALERQAALQRENAALSLQDAELAATERVETLARAMGMQFAQPAQLRFLAPTPARAAVRAAGAELRSPASRPAYAPASSSSDTGQGGESAQGAPAAAEPGGEAQTAAAAGEPQGAPSSSGEAQGAGAGAPAGAPGTTSSEATAAAGATGTAGAAGAAEAAGAAGATGASGEAPGGASAAQPGAAPAGG